MTTKTKTTAKATHTGHCQVCGSIQKLPRGVLSKHGYTTKWGFFSGICCGADHLPFEQDTSLIEGMITRAVNEAKVLREEAARERTESDPENVWYYAYLGREGYRWVRTRIFFDAGIMKYMHPGSSDRPGTRPNRVHSSLSYDLTKAANECNNSHADYLEKEAAKRDEYIQWQQDRIKDWKSKELTPIN